MVRSQTGNPRLVHAMICVMSLCIILAVGGPSLAQSEKTAEPVETTARKITPASFDLLPSSIATLPVLPVGFSKPLPDSIDDLREMEQHVQSLVPKLTETTVALTVRNAQGSGVIVSEDGYVLSAAHVSGGPGNHVQITLADGTRATGRSLGRNRTLDASLIKIESPQRKWPYVGMAKLEEIATGNWSIVMGHPGGHQPGRPPVFRLGRIIHVDDRVIQTDNELVGGDSGGPLFDMYGRVIGINSRIGPDTSFNLHTPISAYSESWQRLLDSEDFFVHSNALLGVAAEPSPQGLKLTKVWPDEPAGRAGLSEGDILLEFQSVPVQTLEELIDLVGQHQPGKRVRLKLLRDNREVKVTLRLGRKRK